jgi:hypothetical protein
MTIGLFVVHFVNEVGDQSRTCTLAGPQLLCSGPGVQN